MSQKADEVYLRYILDAITQIEVYTAGVSREDFFRNRLLQDAVVRQVEIIGEAARQVSEELQARYPQVLWREIVGMQNRIVHAYFDLDLEAVWDTVQEDLPQLKEEAQKIVEEFGKGGVIGLLGDNSYRLYKSSIREEQGTHFALVKEPTGERSLYVEGGRPLAGGEPFGEGYRYPLTLETASALREVFPWLSPRRIPGDRPSFGFGDRLGLATPGHIRAVRDTGIFPILAQQSVRENARTGRNFAQVLASAVFGAFQEGYTDGFGADADHLKQIDDALEAADLGYTFFTCDPSDHVVAVEKLGDDELRQRFSALSRVDEWKNEYIDRPFTIAGLGELRFSEGVLMRAAVKYGAAVEFASKMYGALSERLPDGFDYEVSVDETETPTTPLEHLFVAHELRRCGVSFVSLAPRFVGAMEKGVDWRGDLELFRRELRAHAAIARTIGSYRLSLHSGSDKFTLYPLLAEETDGLWHVKTAGTSYLVALEVAAHRAPALFREIASFSISQFAHERASYHISADPTRIPPLDTVSDDELPKIIEEHNGRQVLHVAFGSVLQSPLGDELRLVLDEWEEEHYERLAQHLGRHLEGLGVKNGG